MLTGTCGKNLTWTLDDNGTLTISGAGEMTDCKLKPRAADWYRHGLPIINVVINAGVTSVGHYAFLRDTNLTRVSVPSNINFIGHLSFYGCTNLTSVTVKKIFGGHPPTRSYIDGSAFAFCKKLSAIEIPPNIEFIGDNAFHGCTSLTSVTLPAALNRIGDNAFHGCTSLTSVTLPAALNRIGNNAFSGCTSLKKIYYAAGFNFANKLNAGNNATLIPYSTAQPKWKWKLIGGVLTIYGAGSMRDYLLPNSPPPWYGKRASIKSVLVKRDITYLGDYAFADCVNLTRAVIASSVTSINQKAFAGCTSLGKGIYHPSKFNLPPTATHVPKTDYVVIIDGNFYQPSHRRKPSAIQKIYFVLTDKPVDFRKTFSRLTRPTEMEIETNQKEIRDGAFEGCTSFEKIKIPEGVERIGKRAFANCASLATVIFPASLKEIADEAFMDCTSLETLIFPKNFSVTIGKNAFKNSPYGARKQSEFLADKIAREKKSLDEKFSAHVLPPEPPVVEDELIDPPAVKKNFCGKNLTWTLDDNGTLTISGTGEMYDYFYGGNPWFAQKNLIQRAVVNVGVTKISQRAFQYCGKLSEIILPAGLEEIGKEAFWYCKKLKSVTFPPSVVSIGQLAFYKCESLTSVTIPSSVRIIGYDIFFFCKNLGRIYYRKIYRNRMEVLKRKLSAGNNAKLILLP